jgi:hypothetical protein
MAKDLTDALRQASGEGGASPASPTYQPRALPHVPVLPPIPPRTGSAISQLPVASGGSGGGGFEELDYALREYYSDRTLMTADGLFTLVIRPIARIVLKGGEVAKFAQPTD